MPLRAMGPKIDPGATREGVARGLDLPEPTKLNLLYHVTPFASSDVWLRNIRQIEMRRSMFTGRFLLGISTGDGLVDKKHVIAALKTPPDEIRLFENNPELREAVSFNWLMESVMSADPSEASFYAHAKGVTQPNHHMIMWWRNAM